MVYTELNRLSHFADEVYNSDKYHIVSMLGKDVFKSHFTNSINFEQQAELENAYESLRQHFPLDNMSILNAFHDEILINLASIQTNDQVSRYFQYIKSKMKLISDLVNMGLAAEAIKNLYESRANSYEEDRLRGKYSDVISRYISYCSSIIQHFEFYHEVIDKYAPGISPASESFDMDIDKNSHRLLLLHKLGIFETLYNSHFQHLGAVRFSRLIATILGIDGGKHEGFRPTVNDLISEILKPNSKKSVQTPAAEAKINAFLTELGVKVD